MLITTYIANQYTLSIYCKEDRPNTLQKNTHREEVIEDSVVDLASGDVTPNNDDDGQDPLEAQNDESWGDQAMDTICHPITISGLAITGTALLNTK